GDADGPGYERQAVVLARHLVPAGSGPGRIATLDDPILDTVERQALVEAAPRLLRETSDRQRRLVRSQRERERPALGELDGRLAVDGGFPRGRGCRRRRRCRRRTPSTGD